MDNNYYDKIVDLLVNYKKNKQRLKILNLDYNNMPYDNISLNYNGDISAPSNISDKTANKAIEMIEGKKKDKEYHQLWRKVVEVELAYIGLSKIQKFVIKHKYLDGEIKQDVDIYTREDSPIKRSKYYEVKNEAVKKMAEIIGII